MFGWLLSKQDSISFLVIEMAEPESLASSFSLLFLLCKICGIYPLSLKSYRSDNTFQPSKWGTITVLICMGMILILYNLLIYSMMDEDKSIKAKQSTLTFVIGLFLNYIAPAMLVVDQFTAISNQSKIGSFFDRVKSVDEKLAQENIYINNELVKKRIKIMIIATIVAEITIMLSTYFFLVDYTKWLSILWIMSCVPTLLSVFDKIWFASLLYGLKQRFEAINSCLDNLVEMHHKVQAFRRSANPDILKMNLNNSVGSLSKNKVFPLEHNVRVTTSDNYFGVENNENKDKTEGAIVLTSELSNNQKMDVKLTNFCQLHDEICELGKSLNELWSYPVLVLMAYGFLIFTAQLYFLYCGTQEQPIPSLFRSAKSAIITIIYLFYTSGKCIFLIYLSWKTSLESKRTGICLHKCGVAADNNTLYEIVNHLSLKLLNHTVNFSACGFFSLDMETLYGVSGGITSYLIILIQFNLAAQQAKDAINTNVATYNDTANIMIDDGQNASSLHMPAIAGLSAMFGDDTKKEVDISDYTELLSSTSSTTEEPF